MGKKMQPLMKVWSCVPEAAWAGWHLVRHLSARLGVQAQSLLLHTRQEGLKCQPQCVCSGSPTAVSDRPTPASGLPRWSQHPSTLKNLSTAFYFPRPIWEYFRATHSMWLRQAWHSVWLSKNAYVYLINFWQRLLKGTARPFCSVTNIHEIGFLTVTHDFLFLFF